MSYINLQNIGINDQSGNTINPAQDESVILLRKLVQMAQSLTIVDGTQRQRITLESSTATVATNTSLSATAYNGIDPRQTFIDMGRNVFATAIRPNLIWS